MRVPYENDVERQISRALRLPVVVTRAAGAAEFSVRIRGFDRPHGFRVDARDMLSWVTAGFEPDNLSADLLAEIAASTDLQWHQARALSDAYHGVGIRVELLRNGEPVESTDENLAPFDGLTLSAKMLKTDPHFDASSIGSVAEAVLATIVCLLQLDDQESPGQTALANFQEEGREFETTSRRYERSRSNRAAAIAVHGSQCMVCGFDFDATYGPIADGYVEVHHLVPVSTMESVRVVNPYKDLVPLCANCHRMAHRRWPPFTPSELTANLRTRHPR